MNPWRGVLRTTAYEGPQIPSLALPEIVIAGRSNVGKSSLINALLGAKVAHVSGTPGKTRSINFFDVSATPPFCLVDLPGYGFAARSRKERGSWGVVIERYFELRRAVLAVQLVDFRHGLLGNDRQLESFFEALNLPVCVVFTKVDKIALAERAAVLSGYRREGFRTTLEPVLVSSLRRDGLETLQETILGWVARQAPSEAEESAPRRC